MNGIISKLFCTFRLPTDRNACSSLPSRVTNSNPFHLNENAQGALWISNTWHDFHWIVARNKQPLYQWKDYSALACQHGSTSIIRKKNNLTFGIFNNKTKPYSMETITPERYWSLLKYYCINPDYIPAVKFMVHP